MTDAAAPSVPARSMPRAPFESAVYKLSPLGLWGTTVGILLLLLVSFAAALALDHYPPFAKDAHGWNLEPGVWPGCILSLLVAVALGMQRYARTKDNADEAALCAVMPACKEFATGAYSAETLRRLRWATGIGIIAGFGPTLLAVPQELISIHPAMYLWFAIIDSLVGALFARGIVQSAQGTRGWADGIERGLVVDLLRIDSLNVIGRHGARNALIWFSVAAVILLFFIGNNMDAVTFAILLLAAAMGIWIFIRPMEQVHRRIRATKQAELDAIRQEIQHARAQASREPGAIGKLQGLLAFEARIEAVREWPFDLPTGLRVGTYVLIPAIPWFGQAIAGYFVANFVHFRL